jgi:hypothetical protein
LGAVYFEQFLGEKNRKAEFEGYFFLGKNWCTEFDKKWVGLNFGRFFSNTHLVTLLGLIKHSGPVAIKTANASETVRSSRF